MNSSRRILVYLLVLLVALAIAWRLTRVTPPTPKPPIDERGAQADTTPVASAHVVIVIEPKGPGGSVPDTTFHRTRRDFVQWQNDTDKPFTIVFKDDPSTTDDDKCPFEEGCVTIQVGPHLVSNTYRIADRAEEHGKRIRFWYYSKTTPLEGPPDGPGWVVED